MKSIRSVISSKIWGVPQDASLPSDNPEMWLKDFEGTALETMRTILSRGYDHRTIAVALRRGLKAEDFIEWNDPQFAMFRGERSPRIIPDYLDATRDVTGWINAGHPIALVGDYDVDGATSVAIMGRLLRDCGYQEGEDVPLNGESQTEKKTFRIKIPERSEGYGFTPAIAQAIASTGIRHAIVLDSGTTAMEAINEAVRLGISLVIVDHHQPLEHGSYPELSTEQMLEKQCLHVINPLRGDGWNKLYWNCCTAGLAYLWAWNIKASLQGWFRKTQTGIDGDLIDMEPLSILAAVGTVADIMVLTPVNRLLVLEGMSAIRALPGIDAVFEAYGRLGTDDITDEGDIGFTLAPLVNASGRLEGEPGASSRNGSALFLAPEPSDRQEYEALLGKAEAMKDLNEARKDTQNTATLKALETVAGDPALRAGKVLVYQADIPEGVIGLVASRLLEVYNKPTIVFSDSNKGSGRSLKGFNLGRSFHKAVDLGLLAGGGGHEMAAGASLAPGKIDAFRDFMNKQAENWEPEPVMIDFDVNFEDISLSFVRAMEDMKPFGNGNTRPLFLLRNVFITGMSLSKSEKVLNIDIEGPNGEMRSKGCIMFPKGTPLGDYFMNEKHDISKPVSMIAEVSIDQRFRKGDMQIIVRDIVK